jgi:hypothetical protein
MLAVLALLVATIRPALTPTGGSPITGNVLLTP